MPRVSVLLPTYNGSRTIGRAIESVLSQTASDLELVVINDASVDDTVGECMRAARGDTRVRIVTNPRNLHICCSLNRGIEESSGEFIARIDDDDEWCDPEKLQKQLQLLDADRRLGLVGTWAALVDQDGRPLGVGCPLTTDDTMRKVLLRGNQFVHSSVVFRRTAAGRGYDPALVTVEDYELWLRIGTSWRFANIPEPCVRYRVNPAGISQRQWYRQKCRGLAVAWRYRAHYPSAVTAVAYRILEFPIPPFFVDWIRRRRAALTTATAACDRARG